MTTTPYSPADIALSMVVGGRTLLDVGCRVGLSDATRRWGCEVVALAEDESLFAGLGEDVEQHLVDLDAPDALDPLEGRFFHQVVAIDVLDTLVDPLGFLRSVAKRLEPDGQVVMNLPNVANAGTALQLLSGYFADSFDNPASGRRRHLFDWSGVERLVGGAGFTITEVIEVHREPDPAGAMADLAPEIVSALLRQSSSVQEWVVVATLVPHERETTPMRRWLGEALARAAVIEEATDYARNLERSLASLEAQVEDLRARLDDALLLKREVEWQARLITEATSRAERSEQRALEVQQAYDNALALAASHEVEILAIRRRLLFRLVDPLAARLYRYRLVRAIARAARPRTPRVK